jgi:hypothetical protein
MYIYGKSPGLANPLGSFEKKLKTQTEKFTGK